MIGNPFGESDPTDPVHSGKDSDPFSRPVPPHLSETRFGAQDVAFAAMFRAKSPVPAAAPGRNPLPVRPKYWF